MGRTGVRGFDDLAENVLIRGPGRGVGGPRDGVQGRRQAGLAPVFLVRLEAGDVVVFFNFRTDRGRELTMALSQQDFPEQNMTKLPLHYVTMTNYDDTFSKVHVVYDKEKIKNEKAGNNPGFSISNKQILISYLAESETAHYHL